MARTSHHNVYYMRYSQSDNKIRSHTHSNYSFISRSIQLLISLTPTIPSFPPQSNNSLISPSLKLFPHFPLSPTIPSFPPYSNYSFISPSLKLFPHFPLTPTIPSFTRHTNYSLIFPSLQLFPHSPSLQLPIFTTPTFPSFPPHSN